MKSSQINFFLTKEDIVEIQQYLHDNNVLFLNKYQNQNSIQLENSLLVQIEKPMVALYFVLRSHISDLEKQLIATHNERYIDVIQSNTIEFLRPFQNEKSNKINAGRFYYIKGYYQNNELIDKPLEFLEAADKFFKWFKKQFKNQKINGLEDFHITPRAAEFYKTGGILYDGVREIRMTNMKTNKELIEC